MFRGSLIGDKTLRLHAFPSSVLLLLFASACANGGDSSAPGDDGGLDGTAVGDGTAGGDAHAKDAAKEGAPSGTSAQKACADNAASYCTQLQTCAQFLISTQYGDELTCESRQTPGCLDALAAPGTGWTGDKLEACVQARTALDCKTFLYGKPAPSACRITGQATSQGCLYGAQCGTGYCRIAPGSSCGNCVALGLTGALCTSSADCDGNLLCAGSGTCQPPSAASSPCSASQPCAQGLACIGGTCVAPGGLAAACSAANKGADCDYYQGVYCDGASTTCKAYAPAQPGDACGGATPTVCVGGGTCFQSLCRAPVADGANCSASAGLNCMPPQTCAADAGACALFSASQCK